MSFFIASILVIFFTTNSCHGAKLVCNASNSQSVWMRNQCQERLVATHGKRCVFAKSGLSQNHTKTEIVKEACDDPSSNHGQVLTRLFLPSIQKYICFDKCGRLRPKVSIISGSGFMQFYFFSKHPGKFPMALAWVIRARLRSEFSSILSTYSVEK